MRGLGTKLVCLFDCYQRVLGRARVFCAHVCDVLVSAGVHGVCGRFKQIEFEGESFWRVQFVLDD